MKKLSIKELEKKKTIFEGKVKYYEKKIEKAKEDKHRIGFRFYD